MHENNGKPEALLWIDFETTGVDSAKACHWRSVWNVPTCWANKSSDHCPASSARTDSTSCP